MVQTTEDGRTIPDSIFSSLVQRANAEDLETGQFPLPTINYQIFATEEDISAGGEWPPQRFTGRNDNINLYRQLWNGNLTAISPTDATNLRVGVNHFRRAATIVADLLLSAPIEQSPEDTFIPQELEDAAAKALIDQMRFGGSVITAYLDDNGFAHLMVVDPASFYPTTVGGYISVVPFVSENADSSTFDAVEIRVADEEGRVERNVHQWDNGTIGDQIESLDPISTSFSVIVPRSPLIDGWGTSAFTDMAPVVLEQAIRLSSYSHVLNAHESPTLVYTTSLRDVDILAVDDDARYQDDKAKAEQITGSIRDLRQQDVAVKPLAQTSAEYVEYTGNLAASAFYLQHLHQQISLTTGIPQVLYDGGALTSGVALKLMAIALYSQTMAMLERTKLGIETVANRLYGEDSDSVELEWPHYFDVIAESQGDVVV